jgi:hypothetical protein
LLTLRTVQAQGDDEQPIFWLSLDEIVTEKIEVEMVRGETFLPKEKKVSIHDKVNGESSEILGKYSECVPGVVGNALLLDGLSSYVEVTDHRVPIFSEDFSIEAWIALGAYPTHLCPLVDNKIDVNIGYHNGYSFNIDALGRLSFNLATNGQTEELRAPETISLNSWNHVAAVYSKTDGMKIYLNGKLVASKIIGSVFTPAVGMTMDESVSDLSLLIGRSRTKAKPYGTMRPYGTQDVYAYYDGLLDEIKIYDIALSSSSISSKSIKGKEDLTVALPDRTLPSGPKASSKFGAINTTLKYYPAWDAPWHMGDNADVVVRFDHSPCKFVFWRGTNYIPNFVTENDIWFNNAFDEGWNEHGSCEPMSDKRNTYSHVKIIERNDARVVVLWRYGLVDNWNKFAFEDPETGWGDWVEETYYMYPDMTGIRKDVLYSNAPRAAHEWQEDIMVLSPGQTPEDILEYGALTMANMKGETKTFSWEHEVPPAEPGEPKDANIKKINTKSTYKPFSIIRPVDQPRYDIYAGEIRRDVSVFPWWNHWPVATKPTDGRYAQFADRPAHSSLSHWHWDAYEMTDNSVTKLMLIGMTKEDTNELLTIAKSWIAAPELISKGRNISNSYYDQAEKAYKIKLDKTNKDIEFAIHANEEAPLVNPAIIIENWGESDIIFKIDGEQMKRGSNLRYGYLDKLKTTDLIIWIQMESEEAKNFSIENNALPEN